MIRVFREKYRLCLFIALWFMAGCTQRCVEGGVSGSGAGSIVDVPVRMPNSSELNPASFWKDSGHTVDSKETLKILVDGAVSMCPNDDYKEKDVLVPSVFCQDGSIPNFTPYGAEGSAATCHGDPEYSKTGYYVDANITVSGGDYLKFTLIPKKVRIDGRCTLPSGASIDSVFKDSSGNIKTWEDVCRSPGKYKIYSYDAGDWSDEIDFSEGGGHQFIDRMASAIVTNDPTPYGNKLKLGMSNFISDTSWLPGIEFDFRQSKPAIGNSSIKLTRGVCDTVNYSQNVFNALREDPYLGRNKNPSFFANGAPAKDGKFDENHPLVKTIDAYKLNCWCGRICGVADNLYRGNHSCYVSMLYKPNASSSGGCEAEFDPDPEEILNILNSGGGSQSISQVSPIKIEVDKDTKVPLLYAPFLSAKIGDSDRSYNAPALQCIPGRSANESCLNFGYKTGYAALDYQAMPLNKFLPIDPSVPRNSKLMLGIADDQTSYADNSGGYNVRVTRMCSLGSGKKLYMYIGDSPPNLFPGENGTISLSGSSGSGSAPFEINKDNPPAKGKIYFAVDTRGYTTDYFLGDSVNYEVKQRNKYRVHVFRPTWRPNFSKLFVSVRNVLLQIFYGVKGGGSNAIDDIAKGVNGIFTPSGSKSGGSSISAAQNSSASSATENIISSFNDGGVVKKLYKNYVTGGRLGLFVRLVMVTYIMYTAVGYVLGVIRASLPDLVIRITKVAVVAAVFSPASWDIFGNILFGVFVNGATKLIADFSGFLDADDSFAFFDNTAGVLLSGDTWIRFTSLILAGPMGWVIFAIVVWSSFVFLSTVVQAMVGYLMLIIGMALLMVLSPLFISFIMFQRTKQLFDGWMRMLLNFMLQPIIVFATLAFLNQILLTSLYQMTSFSACPVCGLKVELHIGDEDGVYCLFHYLSPVGYAQDASFDEKLRIAENSGKGQDSSFMGLPVGFVYVLIFYLVSSAMRQFVNIAEQLANSLSSVFGPISIAAHSAGQALLGAVGLDRETRQMVKNAARAGVIDPTKISLKGKVADSVDVKSDTDKSEKMRSSLDGEKDSKQPHKGGQSDKSGSASDDSSISSAGEKQDIRKEVASAPPLDSSGGLRHSGIIESGSGDSEKSFGKGSDVNGEKIASQLEDSGQRELERATRGGVNISSTLSEIGSGGGSQTDISSIASDEIESGHKLRTVEDDNVSMSSIASDEIESGHKLRTVEDDNVSMSSIASDEIKSGTMERDSSDLGGSIGVSESDERKLQSEEKVEKKSSNDID